MWKLRNKGRVRCPVGFCQKTNTTHHRKMLQIDREDVEKSKIFKLVVHAILSNSREILCVQKFRMTPTGISEKFQHRSLGLTNKLDPFSSLALVITFLLSNSVDNLTSMGVVTNLFAICYGVCIKFLFCILNVSPRLQTTGVGAISPKMMTKMALE